MYAVFEVFLGEVVDGVESFLGFGLVIAKQNFLNVRQAVAQEHVFGSEEADATRALVEGGKCFGGFGIGSNVEGFDFLASIEDGLSRFFELGGDGHGDFAQVDFARCAADGDVIAAFDGVAVVGECAGGFVDGDFGGADDGGDTPYGLFGYFWSAVLSLRDTHGFRHYALRAYAPLRPAMYSTAARSVRMRWVDFNWPA